MGETKTAKSEYRPPMIWFAYFSVLLCWAVNVLFFFATTNPDLIMLGNGSVRLADFVGYYEAAKLSFERANLYDFNTQLSMLNQIIAPAKTEIAWAIPYPPTFYMMVAPLSLLSLTSAYVFWKFVSVPIGMLGASCLLFAQKRFSKVDRAAILLGVISNTPALLAIRAGQFSFLQLALICVYCWAFFQERSILAGLCLGFMGVIKPHYAIFLCIPVLILRRWKILAGAVPLASAIAAFTVMRFGWHTLPDYARYLSEVYTSPQYTGIAANEQVNLRALLMYDILHLPASNLAVAFGSVTLLLGLIFLAWLWIKAAKRPDLHAWLMATTIVLALFLGPHVHVHDCLMLCAAAILTLPSVTPPAVMKEKDLAYRTWCLTLIFYPLVSIAFFSLSAFGSEFRVYPVLAQNLILSAAGIVYVLRQLKGGDPSAAS